MIVDLAKVSLSATHRCTQNIILDQVAIIKYIKHKVSYIKGNEQFGRQTRINQLYTHTCFIDLTCLTAL